MKEVIKTGLSISFIIVCMMLIMICLIEYTQSKKGEMPSYNFEDQKMTRVYFEKYQEILNKYEITKIRQDTERSYKLLYLNYNKQGIDKELKDDQTICNKNDSDISFYVNNDKKELKYKEFDIYQYGKEKVFNSTANCMYNIEEYLNKKIEKEKHLTEDFKVGDKK